MVRHAIDYAYHALLGEHVDQRLVLGREMPGTAGRPATCSDRAQRPSIVCQTLEKAVWLDAA